MEQNEEKIIANIIRRNLPIEWMRYNMFSVNDIYKNIPMLVFRLDTNSENTAIDKLKKSVSDFRGKRTWKVFRDLLSRKGNYLLTIEIVETIRETCRNKNKVYAPKEYLGEDRYRLYCEQAIQDIPLLAKYIDEHYKNIQSNSKWRKN